MRRSGQSNGKSTGRTPGLRADRTPGSSWYRQWGKTLVDVTGALVGVLLLSPLLLVVALLVWISMGRPVLFSQERPGRGGKPFVLYKFRTMSTRQDDQGRSLPDRQRLTALGAVLRATSLDELPELFCVLAGTMSLVGPRPLLMRYMPYFRPHETRRFEVKPGITGLAQVSGRNALAWERRLGADVAYVENLSFSLDMAILAKTVVEVLQRKDVHVVPDTVMQDLDAERSGSACKS